MPKKIVLAYSGGLDTSVILKWLQNKYECPVVTFTADIGQGDELSPIEAKAKNLGVEEIFIEDLKDELDEIFEDLNDNGIYDMGEPFVDQNEDGQWTQNNPPTKPDGFGGRHLLGTDNTGRDVFARVVDGFKVSITFAVICTFLSYSIGKNATFS